MDRVLNEEHLYEKIHAENGLQKLIPDLFLILLNKPKQPLHARNYFTHQIFWKRIYKKLLRS